MDTMDLVKREAFKVFNKFSKIYFQFEALGTENLPDLRSGNALIVLHHTAFFGLDGYLTGALLTEAGMEQPIRTLVWKRFLEGPLGSWFKAMGCIEAEVDTAAKHLRAGENILVMPEGTDATDVRNRINRFHKGYLRILREVPSIPLIPVGFYGIDQAIPWWLTTNRHIVKKMMAPLDIGLDFYIFPKFPVPRPTKIVFAVGEPITFAPGELETEEQIEAQNQRVKGIIADLIDRCEAHRAEKISTSPLNRALHRIVGGETTILPPPF